MKHLTFNKRLRNFVRALSFKTIVVTMFFLFSNESKPHDSYYVSVTFDNGETHYISSKIVKKQAELMQTIEGNLDKQKAFAEYFEWEKTVRQDATACGIVANAKYMASWGLNALPYRATQK